MLTVFLSDNQYTFLLCLKLGKVTSTDERIPNIYFPREVGCSSSPFPVNNVRTIPIPNSPIQIAYHPLTPDAAIREYLASPLGSMPQGRSMRSAMLFSTEHPRIYF